MRFNVGDTIRNRISQEIGSIVRIADPSLGKAYIVRVDSGPPSYATKEALWRESEVEQARA